MLAWFVASCGQSSGRGGEGVQCDGVVVVVVSEHGADCVVMILFGDGVSEVLAGPEGEVVKVGVFVMRCWLGWCCFSRPPVDANDEVRPKLARPAPASHWSARMNRRQACDNHNHNQLHSLTTANRDHSKPGHT